jgi:hypothetical protein
MTLDPIADQGYVYLDDSDAMGTTGTLRYNQLMTGQLALTGVIVQKNAQPTTAVLWPAHAAVVYTIASEGSTDGLYINASLPFTGLLPPPPSGPDAGTPEASVDLTPANDTAGADATPIEVPGADGGAPGG